MYRFILFGLFLQQAGARPPASPQLRIEAPAGEFATIRTQLESFDSQRLADVAELLGLNDAGRPIKVVLANESSDWARQVPAWIAGFAISGSDMVVIFPSRSPTYPQATLEDVLRHEVAHILIDRATAGRPIPRWFNEGLAMASEHGWRFEDQTQLLYQLVVGSQINWDALDGLFAGNQSDQTRAYALAGAFVRDLIRRLGSTAAASILMHVRHGIPFDTAFADVAGMTLSAANADFWRRQRVWTTWAPIITSSATVWSAITLLALVAIRRRRQKNLEIEKAWEREEGN